jgi:hypothetical protein
MPPHPTPQELRPILVSALQLLAADYDEQVAVLPDYVHVPDELALHFDDAMVLVPQIQAGGLIDESAVRAIEGVDQALRDVPEWTLDALRTDPGGATVRHRAREVLDHLGEPRGPIDLSFTTYVSG